MSPTKREQLDALRANALNRKGEAEAPAPPAKPPEADSKPEALAQKAEPQPKKKRPRSNKPKPVATQPTDDGLPQAIRRDHLQDNERYHRMPLDLPQDLEPFRKRAQAAGLTKTHLALTALASHGPAMRQQVADGGVLMPYTGSGQRTRWYLDLTPRELQKVTDFIEDVSEGMPRKSNAAVISLLLARTAGLVTDN